MSVEEENLDCEEDEEKERKGFLKQLAILSLWIEFTFFEYHPKCSAFSNRTQTFIPWFPSIVYHSGSIYSTVSTRYRKKIGLNKEKLQRRKKNDWKRWGTNELFFPGRIVGKVPFSRNVMIGSVMPNIKNFDDERIQFRVFPRYVHSCLDTGLEEWNQMTGWKSWGQSRIN